MTLLLVSHPLSHYFSTSSVVALVAPEFQYRQIQESNLVRMGL